MNIIKWDGKFETGIDIIDFQHKLILSRGNDLINEINNNGSKASIELIFYLSILDLKSRCLVL